jgi:hypothetical protein
VDLKVMAIVSSQCFLAVKKAVDLATDVRCGYVHWQGQGKRGEAKKGKAVPLHAMQALGGRGDIGRSYSFTT